MKLMSLRAIAGVAALGVLAGGPFVLGAAAPAYAQGTVATEQYTVGNGSVQNATASAQPDTAGATANYTVGFTTPSTLTGGSSTVTLSDPAASTVFPGNTDDYFIVDDTSSTADQAVSSAEVASGGHSVTVGLSATVRAGASLSIYVVGATNPSSAGTYSLQVSTSANPVPTSTGTYQVVAAAAAPAFAPSAAPPMVGGFATYTIGVFKAASALSAGDWLKVVSSSGAAADDNVVFPGAASAYKVTDLTTGGAGTVPSDVEVSGVGTGLTGESVALKVAGSIASGDELSVTANGVKNPTTTQLDTLGAAAPQSAAPVSATVQVGTSVVGPTIALSDSTEGASGVGYVVGFKPLTALPAGGTVTIVAPSGTSFSGASITLVDVTHSAASANIQASSVKASATSSSSSDNQLVFGVPAALSAGDTVYVEVDGATNPPAGDYGGTEGDFTVATSADVIPVGVPSYAVTAAPAPVLATIQLSSSVPGETSQYTIGDLKTTAALVAGSSTIGLATPTGTVLPGAVAGYEIADLTNTKASAAPASVSGGGSDGVTLTLGANVASGDFIEIVVRGASNPPSGVYSSSVEGDIVAAVAPATAPPVPPAPVSQPHHNPRPAPIRPAWPKYLTSGTLLVLGHRYYVVVAHSFRSVTGARVLVAYRGRHGKVMTRWSYRVTLRPPMGRRLIEVRYANNKWVRWDGRLYRVSSLSKL